MVYKRIFEMCLFLTLLTFSESHFKRNSKCGQSFDREVISETCKPKFCGIRTWNVTNKDNVLTEAKHLTKLIFDSNSDIGR